MYRVYRSMVLMPENPFGVWYEIDYFIFCQSFSSFFFLLFFLESTTQSSYDADGPTLCVIWREVFASVTFSGGIVALAAMTAFVFGLGVPFLAKYAIAWRKERRERRREGSWRRRTPTTTRAVKKEIVL
jgi:hypothetical protein